MPLHRYMYLNICGYINIVYTYICIEISLFVFIFNYLEIVFVLYFIYLFIENAILATHDKSYKLMR